MMKTIKMAVAALVAALGLLAEAEWTPTVLNAGFEDAVNGKTVAWSVPTEMRVERGVGHNGSAGLVWESATPAERRVAATQVIDIQGGRAYRFSVLIKTDSFKGPTRPNGAKMAVSVMDERGKTLCGAYPIGVSGTVDWMHFEGIVEVPDDARKLRLMLSVLKGSTGRVCFDDVSVECEDLPAAAFAFSSAYRNVAASGPLRFFGHVRPQGRSMDELKAAFVFCDPDGRVRSERAILERDRDELFASLTTSVEKLMVGEQDVTFVVRDQNDVCLGSYKFQFVRVAEKPKRRVEIDGYGRCIVNGEPFFPVGLYSHKMTEEDAAIYATGPFNSVIVYGLSTTNDLARLARHGIMCVSTLKNEIPGRKHAIQRGIRTTSESESFFRDEIEKLKNEPNLLAWYVCDEAPIAELNARCRLYELFRKCDPDHPCWAVMDKLPRLRDWLSICDVLGADPYPISGKPMSQVAEFCDSLRAATQGARAYWNVPQNFDWSWYRKPKPEGEPDRMPTTREMAFFNWCHIAGGANGLFGYTYSAIRQEWGKRGKKEDFETHWKSICAAYADVKRLSPVLLSIEPVPRLPRFDLRTPVRLWRKGDCLYVLACNAKSEQITLSMKPGSESESWKRLEGVESGGTDCAKMSDGVLTFILPPTTYSMVRLGQ